MTNMIQVCSNFHWTRVFCQNTWRDEIMPVWPVGPSCRWPYECMMCLAEADRSCYGVVGVRFARRCFALSRIFADCVDQRRVVNLPWMALARLHPHALHSHATFLLEWCDKIKLSNLLLPRKRGTIKSLQQLLSTCHECLVSGLAVVRD
jgi:hypothetical protein